MNITEVLNKLIEAVLHHNSTRLLSVTLAGAVLAAYKPEHWDWELCGLVFILLLSLTFRKDEPEAKKDDTKG